MNGCFVPWFEEEWGNSFTISMGRENSTKGLTNGPIMAGEWMLTIQSLQIPDVVSKVPVRGRTEFKISIYRTKQDPQQAYCWYAGDLHTHTHHSDGIYSPEQLIALAKGNGLQFLCITDHNTLSTFDDLPNLDESFLVLQGIECTTVDRGHANAIGIQAGLDWHVYGDRTFNHIADDTRRLEGLFCINHPYTDFGPWNSWEMDFSKVDCFEVWNSLSERYEQKLSLAKWDEFLNAGYKMTGVGGSDAVHRVKRPHRPGYPKTWVLAEKLTRADIMKGIKEGRVLVTAGPFFDAKILFNHQTYCIGDHLPVDRDALVNVEIESEFQQKHVIQIVVNGQVVKEWSPESLCKVGAEIEVQNKDWVRVQLKDENDDVLGFTNPFFMGLRS